MNLIRPITILTKSCLQPSSVECLFWKGMAVFKQRYLARSSWGFRSFLCSTLLDVFGSRFLRSGSSEKPTSSPQKPFRVNQDSHNTCRASSGLSVSYRYAEQQLTTLQAFHNIISSKLVYDRTPQSRKDDQQPTWNHFLPS